VLDREEVSAEVLLDSLKHELSELEALHPETGLQLIRQRKGWPASHLPGFLPKVRHRGTRSGLLTDAFTEDDIKAFDERVRRFFAERGGE